VKVPLAHLTVATRDGSATAVFSGEIDMSNTDDLDRQLHDELGAVRTLRVDLTAVTYIDSQGVRMLHHIIDRHFAGEVGITIEVAEDSIPADLLAITAINRLVPVVVRKKSPV
jgi:anti-anti-sigma factor